MTGTESGWYLRHRDGIEHGPFRFADIVAAAKLGNIASDTCVRHETQTLGQWAFAPRVQPIAEVMVQATPKPTPTAKQTPTRAAARASTQAPTAVRRASSPGLAPAAVSEPAAVPHDATSKVDPVPTVRTYREQGYPVPRTFVDACVALLDVRFRWFVTPWIVKVLWALSISFMILWAGKLIYENFIQGEVPATTAASALGATGEWQFEPLGDQPFLQSRFFRLVVTLGAMFVGLLCIRVVCEAGIVLIRAANDLHDLKTQGKE